MFAKARGGGTDRGGAWVLQMARLRILNFCLSLLGWQALHADSCGVSKPNPADAAGRTPLMFAVAPTEVPDPQMAEAGQTGVRSQGRFQLILTLKCIDSLRMIFFVPIEVGRVQVVSVDLSSPKIFLEADFCLSEMQS